MNEKVWKEIALTCTFGSISFATFIGTMMAGALKQQLSSAFAISIALMLKKFTKLFVEAPFAAYADLKGSRNLLLLSSFASIVVFGLLFSGYRYAIFAAVIISGVDSGIKTGKVESRVYNILKSVKSEPLFPKVMSVYFVMSNTIMGICSFVAGGLYQNYGVKGVFVAVCIQSALAFLCVLFMAKGKEIPTQTKKNNGISTLIKDSCMFIAKFPVVTGVAMLLGFYNFFGWQFLPILNLYMMQKGIGDGIVMKFDAILLWAMAIGSALSFFVAGKVSLRGSFLIWLLQCVVMLVLISLNHGFNAFGANFPLFCAGLLIYTLLYATIEIVAVKYLESIMPSGMRYILTSIVDLFSITTCLFGNLYIGYIADVGVNGYDSGIFIAILTLILMAGIGYFVFFRKSKLAF